MTVCAKINTNSYIHTHTHTHIHRHGHRHRHTHKRKGTFITSCITTYVLVLRPLSILLPSVCMPMYMCVGVRVCAYVCGGADSPSIYLRLSNFPGVCVFLARVGHSEEYGQSGEMCRPYDHSSTLDWYCVDDDPCLPIPCRFDLI